MAEKVNVSRRALELGVDRTTYYRYRKAGMPGETTAQVQQAWIREYKGQTLPARVAVDNPPLPLLQAGPLPGPQEGAELGQGASWKEENERFSALLKRQKLEEGEREIVLRYRRDIAALAQDILVHIRALLHGPELCDSCRDKVAAAAAKGLQIAEESDFELTADPEPTEPTEEDES